MKRILSLALICVILVISLVPNAAATETEDSDFVEVLDFCLPNEGATTKIYIRSGASYIVAGFTMQQTRTIQYIDIIFESYGVNVPSTVYLGSTTAATPETAIAQLTVVNIHDNVYRAYGQLTYTSRGFYVFIGERISAADFLSVRVSYNPFEFVEETGSCIVMAYGFNDTINYIPTDTINHRSFTGDDDVELNFFDAYITPHNWQKYDYIDILFQADLNSIDTVSAQIGKSIIPFTISYLDNGMTIENHYNVALRLDLRSIDRDSTEWFNVHVEGTVNNGSTNLFGIFGIRGYYKVASYDTNIGWFVRIYGQLKSILGELTSIYESLRLPSAPVDEFKEESANVISGLDSISSSMDSVDRPSMDAINADFTGDISDAAVLMTGLFSEVTGIPWLSTIILASCTLGLISYILYGKE